jgi:hypothetical protein
MDGAPSDREPLEVPAGDGEDPLEPGLQQVRANVARAIDLYMDLFQRTFEAYADLTEAALRRRDVTIGGDGAGPSPAAPLTLRIAENGFAEGGVWLHNATGAPVGLDRVGTTPLASHTGDVKSATASLSDVEATLARYGELTGRAMREFLAGGGEAPYLTDLLADYPNRGGKALRPSLSWPPAKRSEGRCVRRWAPRWPSRCCTTHS